MTQAEVRELLSDIQLLYPNYRVSDPRRTLDLWSVILQDDDADHIREALMQIAKTSSGAFAPSVGEIRETALMMTHKDDYPDTSAAVEALQVAMRAVGRDGRAAFDRLPQTVRETVGSVQTLRSWTHQPVSEIITKFSFAYKDYIQIAIKKRLKSAV